MIPKFLLIIVATAILIFSYKSMPGVFNNKRDISPSIRHPHNISKAALVPPEKVVEAKTFVQNNGYNDKLCFIINMSQPSGSNRFFVYDFKKDTITDAGLVTHGNCNQYWLEGRKYSNAIGCGCTSLGKYKIGSSYMGKFGLAYKLYGLDSTNTNAFKRYVVLHSHACVPDGEIKDDICQSLGCPTVSPQYLNRLQKIINASTKPVLLWILEK